MKRARIKAMVTVPTRRKVTQDVSPTETVNETESDEKNKSASADIPVTLQSIPKNSFVEEQTEDTSVITSETDERFCPSEENDNLQCKNEITQSYNESRTEVVQTPEVLNKAQIVSSTKLTQTRLNFMRPTPKFDSCVRVRKNSIQGSGASASESEDDSRRVTLTATNHIRDDLVSAVQNTKDAVPTNTKSNFKTKSKVGQKKRTLVSESARRLAEARREFHLKHENKLPDRTKLTMYDLIYYNPVSNPMKKSKGSGMLPRQILESQPEEFPEEETEDDPTSAMPVPQVKVGPDGQLIIDEQSLVIEQTNAKRNRDILAKEVIVDDDNNGSGFYKKRHKSKEWSKWETLKFYKALNTVGTDFLLMQSLFPNRTRQEIKLKFKKEEKINRNLVEKVLANHQEFDTEILEKSLATFEDLEKEQLKTQEKQKKHETEDKKILKSGKKRTCRIVASSIAEREEYDEEGHCLENLVEEMDDLEDNEFDKSLKEPNKKRCKQSEEEKTETEISLTKTDDGDLLSLYNEFDSDTEVYRVRPTRSGRLPKVKKLQGPDVNSLDTVTLDYCASDNENSMFSKDKVKDADSFDNSSAGTETYSPNSIKTVIPNIDEVEPGSLVILSKELPEEPGKNVLQVYMVSSNINSSEDHEKSNITPVHLPPELLATVTSRLSNVESVPVKEECE